MHKQLTNEHPITSSSENKKIHKENIQQAYKLKNRLSQNKINSNPNSFTNYKNLNYDYFSNIDVYQNLNNSTEENEQIIIQLQNENKELRNDIRHLFQITDQNKNELQKNLVKVTEDNHNLKKENFDLKNRIILQDNIIKNLEADKTQIENQKTIIKAKYENEILELNSQLNEYKLKLNTLNLEYQNILHNYHQLKSAVILEQTKNEKYVLNEERKHSISEKDEKQQNISINNHNNRGKINTNPPSLEKQNSIINNNINNLSYKQTIPKKTKSKTPLRHNKLTSKFLYKTISNETNKKLIETKLRHSFTSLNSENKLKSNNSTVSHKQLHQDMKTQNLAYIDKEIANLERKIADLNISYQTFLLNLQSLPNNSFKESQELKQTLCYLENTIHVKIEKLQQLKSKQQSPVLAKSLGYSESKYN